MVNSTEDFEAAYCQIRALYKHFGMTAGNLTRIGFRNKWNFVLAEGDQAGLAFNFTADHAVYGAVTDMDQFARLQQYIGRNLTDLTEALLSEKGIQMRSLCLAALNALSQPLLEKNRLEARGLTLEEAESFDFINYDDVVTIVGYGGMYSSIYDKCKELHITDMRPKTALQTLTVDKEVRFGPPKITFHDADENEDVISKSDVVFMTGCTLVNGTFRELIQYAKKARIIGMYGPSAAIIPEYLAAQGINWISSSQVLGRYIREPQFEYAMDLNASNKSMMRPYHIRYNGSERY
jgi:uncharacterized protein (DUF4213/DUF364 family)